MSAIRYALAMLAAGGAAAAGSAAGATTVFTDTFDVSATTPLENLATSDALNGVFSYGQTSCATTTNPTCEKSELASNTFGVGSFGSLSSSPGINEGPAPDPLPFKTVNGTETDATNGVADPELATEPYLHLEFVSGGQEYAGTATFGPDANMGGANTELETISFEAVPEPAAWALLIAGAGLAGAGLRRRRAQLAAA